ncbi:MAG TPA: hypothetical protein VFU43_10745 [Streptosporangiaceae bacterium]|nr:hypothetical protein [Streptosporangiaceae bacterium]
MLVAEFADSFGEFIFGPVGVSDEVEVLVFFPVEFGELFLEVSAAFVVDRVVVCDDVVD